MSQLHAASEAEFSMAGRLDPDQRKSRIHLPPEDQLAAVALDLRLILELASQRFMAEKDPARAAGFVGMPRSMLNF